MEPFEPVSSQVTYRYALIAAWVVATCASVLLAFAGVATVRTALAGPGSFQLPPEAVSPPSSDPAMPTGQTPSEPVTMVTSTTVDLPDTTTVSTAPSSTAAEAVPSSEPAGEDTNQGGESEGDESEDPGEEDTTGPSTYELNGGWVSIRSDSEGVYLESASPRSGWNVEVEGKGPEEFKVIFKKGENKSELIARFEDEHVQIEIKEE